MKKTLGEIAKIDSKRAARSVRQMFAHDLLNTIAKYRAQLYRAQKASN